MKSKRSRSSIISGFARVGWWSGLLLIGIRVPNAAADFYIHPWDDHHEAWQRLQAAADLTYYRTTTDYDTQGSLFSPTGLNSYQRYLLDLEGTYGITPRLSIFGRLDWEMAKLDSDDLKAYSGTSYGLGDQTLAINYRVYDKPGGISIDLQLQGDFGTYSNANAQTNLTPFLGDASIDVTPGAFITLPFAKRGEDDFLLMGGAGYTYRTSSFSAAIPWTIAAKLSPKAQGFLADLSFSGFQSLKTDSSGFNPATSGNATANNLGSGGSYVTNAVNPSLINLRGQLGYVTSDDLQFTATVQQSVWGRQAPNGLSLALGFQTHFGGHLDKKERPGFESAREYGRSNKGYVNYNLESKVLRANDRFNMVKLDKGSNDGIQVGDTFDIFMTKPNGTEGPAIARGRVTNVKSNESAVKIEEYFREVWIEEGSIARRPIQ